jgi:uncharacterized phiE125 gp8 family phage protein
MAGLFFAGYGDPDDAALSAVPLVEPVTLLQAKQQTRRTEVTTDDAYLVETLIPAARQRGEQATQRQFQTGTYDLKLDAFPCMDDCDGDAIVLPRPPLQKVVSITYVDTDGATQTLSTALYSVFAPTGPLAQRGWVEPIYGETWPSTRDQSNAVTIRFVAGYGDEPTDVPPRLRMAMLQDIGTLHEHREDIVIGQGYALTEFPYGSRAIYRSFKSHG